MKKKKNPFIAFFSSVKLTLFVLFMLAFFSIIGTVIPQNKPAEFYVKMYGDNMAGLFQALDVPDMYSSWWFSALMILLSINMVVCILKRFPNAWRMITMDNLQTKLSRLEKMSQRHIFSSSSPPEETAINLANILNKKGWQATKQQQDGSILLFAQKGRWSRLGVYVFHLSILIIFVGAMIGSFWGYKAGVRIPETTSIDTVYRFSDNKPIKLDFKVLCKHFKLTYYENGAPKEFRSELAIIKDGKEVAAKSIVVNDPLTYGGLTFYQSSYEAYGKMLIVITNNDTGDHKEFLVRPGEEIPWPQADISFGVINKKATAVPGHFDYKIWFNDKKSDPATFWMEEDSTKSLQQSGTKYTISMKEFYATGLQVTKDPGVWFVYAGCVIMILSLIVAFFMSHRRIWIHLSEAKDGGSRILLSGTSNKNRVGFANSFAVLAAEIDHLKRK
jgi:cytochrome c biogenesis protein